MFISFACLSVFVRLWRSYFTLFHFRVSLCLVRCCVNTFCCHTFYVRLRRSHVLGLFVSFVVLHVYVRLRRSYFHCPRTRDHKCPQRVGSQSHVLNVFLMWPRMAIATRAIKIRDHALKNTRPRSPKSATATFKIRDCGVSPAPASATAGDHDQSGGESDNINSLPSTSWSTGGGIATWEPPARMVELLA